MSTIIVYATKHGTTEKCAKLVKDKLKDEVELFNLKLNNKVDLSNYDKVIIGGSIYIGKIQKEASEFCLSNLHELKEKKVGLFICGMLEEQAENELNNAYPKELLDAAIAKDFFGGEFIFSKLNLLDKLIVKKVSKVDKDTSSISKEKISQFVDAMNNA